MKLIGFALAAVFGFAAHLEATSAGLASPLDTDQESARSAAMGSAFVGLADDSTALADNPAGLATLGGIELALNNDEWLVDTYQNQGVAAVPFGRAGTLGVGVSYLDFGSIDSRDALGNQLPADTASRTDIDSAWGAYLFPGVALGLGLQGEYNVLANESDDSLAGNIGLLWLPTPGFRLGFSAINVGTSVAGADQAMAVRGGASYRFDFGQGQSWKLAAALSQESQSVTRLQFGTEGIVYGHLAVRAGYDYDLANTDLSGLTGVTAGLGVSYGTWQVDYAYLPYGELGVSQRLSLTYRWPQKQKAVGAAKAAAPQQSALPGNEIPPQTSSTQDPLALGKSLEAKGKLLDALQVYQIAVKQDARNADVWRAMGNLYYRLGSVKYALQCFEQVLALGSNEPALKLWVDNTKKALAH